MYEMQTLKEFLDNPMGKGSTAIPSRQLIKDDLDKRFKKLKKDKKIEFTVFTLRDEYYFHFLIPSESERENKYDVVIKFCKTEKMMKYDNFLNRYKLQFFSNCPSFTFTYAHTFMKLKILVPFLTNKFTDEIINGKAVTRNPNDIVSFEKSLYFACKYIEEDVKLMNKMYLNTVAKKLDIEEFSKQIRTSDKILLEIKSEQHRIANEKKKDERAKEDEIRRTSRNAIRDERKIKSSIRKIKPAPKREKITARKSSIKKK